MTSCGARWCGDIISTLRNIDFNTKSISDLYQLIKQFKNVSQNEEPERCSLQEYYIDDFSPKIIVSTNTISRKN